MRGDAVCSLVADFVVPGVGSLIAEALVMLVDMCVEMKENEDMCKRVLERLEFVADELYKIADEEILHQNRLLFKFGDTIAKFIKFLNRHVRKSLLRRLASNRKVVAAIETFHEDIDDLYKLLNLLHIVETTKWRIQWEEDTRKTHEQLAALLANTQAIHQESQASNVMESLVMLKYELDFKGEQNSPEQVALLKKAFSKVVSTSKAKVPKIPQWFISSDDVEFDVDVSFDVGAFGSVHRGTWDRAEVVIKRMLMDDDKARESFFKEVEVWEKLDNPHVVKLYGACHVASPAFFVCEDCKNGNFVDFFEKDKTQRWRLLFEAALGLFYLHKEKVVHGDLKCNNILVGTDGKAKIGDFGFSYIRKQSIGLSAKAQTDSIRWKAPECLGLDLSGEFDSASASADADSQSAATRNPRFASDVYSFGMCIWEAFSGEPPFGTDDDETIMEKLYAQEPLPRPDEMDDDQWAFMQKLVAFDWQVRPEMPVVVDSLKRFVEREAEQNAATIADRVCPQCHADVPLDNVFCGKCGCNMGASVDGTAP
jgi:hypothetical protein